MLSLKKSTSTNIFSKSGLFGKGRKKERTLITGVLLIGLVFLIVVSAVLFIKNKEATLLLAFEGDGKGRMFTGEVVGRMTILDALIASANAGRIQLRHSVGADGSVIISGLDGYDSDSSDKKMVFYLNGKRIEAGQINFARINPGDNIEVRLE